MAVVVDMATAVATAMAASRGARAEQGVVAVAVEATAEVVKVVGALVDRDICRSRPPLSRACTD